jgi:hypothetical protein
LETLRIETTRRPEAFSVAGVAASVVSVNAISPRLGSERRRRIRQRREVE